MKYLFMFCSFLAGSCIFVRCNAVFTKVRGDKNPIIASSRIIEKEQILPGYKEIRIAAPFEVFLTEGIPGPLRIEASDNLLPYVVLKVKDSVLFIEITQNLS